MRFPRLSQRAWLIAILVLAVTVRLAYSFVVVRGILGVTPETESSDGYNLIAQNLYAGHGYRFRLADPPTLQRPPAYPAVLVAIFSVAGVNYAIVQVVQALLGALGCWLLFLLGRWVLCAELGLVAAALYALYPNSVIYSSRLYAENLYFPLFLGFAYLLCRAALEGSVRRGIGAGVLWGAGLLTRGTLLPLPLLLPLGVLLSRRHRRPAARWLRWGLSALLAGALVVGPWTLRNYSLTGAFVPVSTWAWGPIYHGTQVGKRMTEWVDLGGVDSAATKHVHDLAVQRFGRADGSAFATSHDEIRYDQIGKDLTLEDWRRDPLGLVQRTLLGAGFAWFFAFDTATRLMSLVIHVPIFLLFIIGVVMMARRYREAFVRAWPALGLIVFVNAFQAVAYAHVRYMAPAIALAFVFAALPLLVLARKLTNPDRGNQPAPSTER
jgi:4-amino-4-deoxy-L-arabinose transferase-like glycosyltransferase